MAVKKSELKILQTYFDGEISFYEASRQIKLTPNGAGKHFTNVVRDRLKEIDVRLI